MLNSLNGRQIEFCPMADIVDIVRNVMAVPRVCVGCHGKSVSHYGCHEADLILNYDRL